MESRVAQQMAILITLPRLVSNLEAEAKYNQILTLVDEYYKLIQPELEQKFYEQTKDLQYYDPYLKIKETYISNKKDENEKVDNDTKVLYRFLAKICHPDKCSEPWAKSIFELINNLYHENNYYGLEELHQYWLHHGTFDQFLQQTPLIHTIDTIQVSPWFRYHVCAITRSYYISRQEYIEIMKQEEEKAKYKKIHKLLQQQCQLESLNLAQRVELSSLDCIMWNYYDTNNYAKLDEIYAYYLQHGTLLGYE